MRVVGLFLASGLFFAATTASAQPQEAKRSSAQFNLHREEPGGVDAVNARARARAGDCKGALPAFDAAVRVTIEPTLRRDRGLCHEKLGDPYPAMEDFRAYLDARPDANDAEQVREHLAHLQEQTGTGGRNTESKDKGDGQLEASASISTNGSSTSSSSRPGKPRREKITVSDRQYDEYVAQERLADEAEYAPLRYGEGWSLGPYLNVPRYFFQDGQTSDLAYGIGGTLRYSTSGKFWIIGEFGYASIGEQGTVKHQAGPHVLLGGELRLGVSRYNSDQLLFGLGVGFERYTNSGTDVGGDIVPFRGKFGYMHVFGTSIGLEFAVEGGPALSIPDNVGPFKPDNKLIGVVGGSVALLVGF